MNIYEKLSRVQSEVAAPKDAFNAFGKYNYRSCESILEAVKPILHKHNCTIILKDEVEHIGERYYIKAVAEFIDCESEERILSAPSYAREEESKKGMDGAQVTGSSSSYARKYALAGLLLLDDNKDPDYSNEHNKEDEHLSEVNEKISQNHIKNLNGILTVYPKENREAVLKSLCSQYKIKDTSELTTKEYVKFRAELLDKAEETKKQRLDYSVRVFAEKSGHTVDEAKQFIELGIEKNIADISIVEFTKYAKQICAMIEDLNKGASK